MDVLDLIIVAGSVAYAFSGYRRGLSWVSFSLAGLLVGLVAGAAVAEPIASSLANHDTQNASLIATGVFLSVVLLIQGIGTAIGYIARNATLRTKHPTTAKIDSIFGSIVAIVGLLASTWFLGLTFSQSRYTTVDVQIQNSGIVRTLDSIAPRPPGFLAKAGNIIRGADFPNPFAALVPQSVPALPIPPTVDTPGIEKANKVTSKVLASGCGVEAGSSWPLGNDYMVTNAHVVAGAEKVVIQPPGGSTYRATVVLYDPEVDVAILHAPGIGLAALPMDRSEPSRGTTGAVVGYPGGGAETTSPAAVRGVESAQGYDIYNNSVVTRRIEVLAASVIPGNSGGPLVDNNGHVIGLVFAASTVNPDEGYALTIPQISDDLNAGQNATAAVSTSNCTS